MRRKGGTRTTTRSGRPVRKRVIVRRPEATGTIAADELVPEVAHACGGNISRIALDGTRVVAAGDVVAVSTDGRNFYRRPAPHLVRALAVDSGAIYALCWPNGMWRSLDVATTWRRVEIPERIGGEASALHRDAFGTWWLATSSGAVVSSRHADKGWRATQVRAVGPASAIDDIAGTLTVISTMTAHVWDGRACREIEIDGERAIVRLLGGPDGWYAIGAHRGLYRSGDRGRTWVQLVPSVRHATGVRAAAWIAGALYAILGTGLHRWTGADWAIVSGVGEVHDLASWGDGAFLAGAGGRIVRFASPRDTYFDDATDELAPRWPDIVHAPDTPATSPAHREEVYADLAREAAIAHEELSAGLRAAHVADDLERAIDDEPGDDTQLLAVLADRLHAAGDPRAELAAVQLAIAEVTRAARLAGWPDDDRRGYEGLFTVERRLLDELAPELAATAGTTVTWRAGWLDTAHLTLGQLDDAAALAAVARVLDGPHARFLRELVVTPSPHHSYARIAELIGARYRPALRELRLGSATGAIPTRANIAAVWPALPNLVRLVVDADGVQLGDVVAPRLQAMEIAVAALPAREAKSIARAVRPDLRVLAMTIGARRNGGTARLDDLEPIFDGAGLPRLERLAIRRAELGDELVARLARSTLLGQLHELDLRHGTISDDGARILVAHQFAFAHLATVELADNFITPAGAALLRASSIKARIDEQRVDPGVAHLRLLP